MDLKALATALTMAFIIVIMDAVFHFHYIYVLAMITALGYVFVRNRTRTPAKETVKPPSWPAILSIGELDPADRDTLTALLIQPATGPKTAIKTTEMMAALDNAVAKPVVLTKSTVKEIPVPYPGFVRELTALLGELSIRCNLSVSMIGKGDLRFCCIRIMVNRKLDLDQSETLGTLNGSLTSSGGIAWVTHPPRKTVINLALPGN